jgi:hypothetical protein
VRTQPFHAGTRYDVAEEEHMRVYAKKRCKLVVIIVTFSYLPAIRELELRWC